MATGNSKFKLGLLIMKIYFSRLEKETYFI